MMALILTIFAFMTSQTRGEITSDFNCTTYNGAFFVYTPAATACQNVIADSACQSLYRPAEAANGYPMPGNNAGRPFACYSTATIAPAPVSLDMKIAALSSCAKTCGLCCQTDAYNCRNADFPRINCASIINTQCNSPAWRTIIASDCPSVCGFCGEGGCVDAVSNCGTDLSICRNIGMQDFVNSYCQKTCARCSSSTTVATTRGAVTSTTRGVVTSTTRKGVTSTTRGSATSGPCTSFLPDSSTSCATWAENGFCTNDFFTLEQRRARCATTCRLC